MASLKEAYEEVDALLASSLPSTIVTSFKPAAHTLESAFLGDADEDLAASRDWRKRDVAYGTLLTPNVEHVSRSVSLDDGSNEQAGEDEPLLPNSQQKEEKREKLAKFALNGKTDTNKFRLDNILTYFVSQFHNQLPPPSFEGPCRALILEHLSCSVLRRQRIGFLIDPHHSRHKYRHGKAERQTQVSRRQEAVRAFGCLDLRCGDDCQFCTG